MGALQDALGQLAQELQGLGKKPEEAEQTVVQITQAGQEEIQATLMPDNLKKSWQMYKLSIAATL